MAEAVSGSARTGSAGRGAGLALLLPLLLAATPAAANQWVVWTGGDRPNREFVAVDEDFINPEFNSDDAFKVEALTVYEAAGKPDWMTANYHVDCNRKTIRIDLVQISPRNGALRRGPDVPERAIASVGENQILVFGCDKGRKKAAQRAQERDANNDPRNFIYMGPISLPKVVDIAWEKLWTDGRRPAATSDVSIAEQNRQVEEIMKKKGDLVAQAGAIARKSQGDADAMKETRERHAARWKREKSIAAQIEDWVGSTEAEIRAKWGPPEAAEGQGDERVLIYRKTDSWTDNVIGGGGLVNQTSYYTCDLRMEFRNGRLYDYFTSGQRCEKLFGPR